MAFIYYILVLYIIMMIKDNIKFYIAVAVIIITIINLFIWTFGQLRHDNSLKEISYYIFLIYPLILLISLMFTYGLHNTFALVILFCLSALYYLYVFLPSYQEGFQRNPDGPIDSDIDSTSIHTKECFQNEKEFEDQAEDSPPSPNDANISAVVGASDIPIAPKGISVRNNQWQNTDKRTVYYSTLPPDSKKDLLTSSSDDFRGQSGPCLVDDRFQYQLGFEKVNRCSGLPAKVPVPSGKTDRARTGDMPDGLKPPKKPFLGDATSTPCKPSDLPPTVGGGNMNFWCRFANVNRRYGAEKLYPGEKGGCLRNEKPDPKSARASCSQLYYDTFYKYGNPKTTTVTDCLPWDTTNFVMACSPNKFKKKIIGECPPSQGRGVCEITSSGQDLGKIFGANGSDSLRPQQSESSESTNNNGLSQVASCNPAYF